MLIKYFADIRKLSGCEREEWTKAAPTLRVLLRELAEHHGASFQQRVVPGGELSSTMIILVNGQHIEHLRGVETPLGADDVVAVFPMVAGG